ncbi:MAG: hypothetical protein ACK6DS_19350 [Planctomycetota bacterium]|jgi:hypothetical protein
MKFLGFDVEAEKTLLILNTQYAIFLGLFMQFVFKVEGSSQGPNQVLLLLDNSNLVPIGCWLFYLVVDWLTTNLTVSVKSKLNHFYLIALIIVVTFLGALPILAIEPNLRFYLFSAAYFVLVPVWDLFLPTTMIRKTPVFPLMLTLRLGVGAFFFLICLLVIFTDSPVEILWGWFTLSMGVFLLLKIVRHLAWCAVSSSSALPPTFPTP